jgi:hypothetical protein
VRAIGLSNYGAELLARAEAVGHVDAIQPEFSAIARDGARDRVGGRARQRRGDWLPAAQLELSPIDREEVAAAIARTGGGVVAWSPAAGSANCGIEGSGVGGHISSRSSAIQASRVTKCAHTAQNVTLALQRAGVRDVMSLATPTTSRTPPRGTSRVTFCAL